ncbi:rhodanese domain-containing protein [Pseudomonas sp. BAY1663]|uniref:Rhodanese-like domain-containing protein n=1 Tax=Stutzerimonas stutzeri TaxID=316 RepID=A0A2N8SQ22_STUST|nr:MULTISPECIES: rhodanese-like domain-containing protein [Pseudomonadaceae]EXF45819.1 rhodanese domain-containing protein [Pseudomonas sp. BAY1663]MCQ4326508.1 rhodanese-like domain-containing protein [Stutzerimonas stutzeri]PNG04580.1 rhodanese-like domain-containing protein [Stutzerimonas stutzeri]
MRMPVLIALLASSFGAMAGDIDQNAALQALQQPGSVLIDVRSAEEFAAGALPGANRIDPEQLAQRIGSLVPDKDTPVVVYCRSGRRSSAAQDLLQELGYRQVINAGGYEQLDSALRQN